MQSGPQSQEAGVPHSSEDRCPSGTVDWTSALHPPDNVTVCSDVY